MLLWKKIKVKNDKVFDRKLISQFGELETKGEISAEQLERMTKRIEKIQIKI